jgi:hypothetical protein
MRRRELSEKIDEEMRLSRLAFERNTLAFERVMSALDRHEKLIEETTLFIRNMNRRSERVVQDLVKGNAEFSAEQKKRTDEIVAEMRDARQESRAHRQAILAMLDRLPPAQAA